jgi:Tol biopolymer transport system component
VAGDVHTQAEPLPTALAGDGSRPLVLLQRNPANPDGLTVIRLDTDGSKPLAIDTGLYHEPRLPRWSPDGSAIAVVDDDVFPHDAAVAATLKARISRLSLIRPDGTGRREVFATQGLPGSGSVSCQPPQCFDTSPALDQMIKGVEWSPDGRALAVTVCARNRYPWGESGDDTCRVELVDATTGAVIRDDLDGWFRPDWSAAGGLLFNGPAQYPSYERRGVWEGDPSVTPPTQNLILPAPLDLLIDGDRLPTWAPDGRHFVTAREMGGYRFDANGLAIQNEAVMLHDRDDQQNPRVLLVADHGGISGAIGDFTWSPDGRYVLYTLSESADAANVWWLDVTTGATGRVTTDGASVSVDWRARAGSELGSGPGSGPTTTTLPPNASCEVAGPSMCDDGDPCTVDTCVAGQGCVSTPASGFESVTCSCRRGAPAACADQSLPASIGKRQGHACSLFDAARTAARAPAVKRLRKATGSLKGSINAVAKARKTRKISIDCADALKATLQDTKDRAERLRATL